jgi:cold shock CspA family protein
MADNGKPRGIVKFYSAEKGFGFICPDDGGHDLFFGARSVVDRQKISADDIVEFDVDKDRQGRPCAINVNGVN